MALNHVANKLAAFYEKLEAERLNQERFYIKARLEEKINKIQEAIIPLEEQGKQSEKEYQCLVEIKGQIKKLLELANKLEEKFSIFVIAICFVLILICANFVFEPHQLRRFLIWLDPANSEYYYNGSFQLANGLIAFAQGGLFGKGFGASTQKFGYIAESQNDFISSIIVEELGVVGFLVFVIVPYCIIIFKMFTYGQKIKETKSKLILYGIATYFFAHILINVGGVSGFIPMTGVPLLMVSLGGSSTLASMMTIGIGQAIIAKYNKDKLKEQL